MVSRNRWPLFQQSEHVRYVQSTLLGPDETLHAKCESVKWSSCGAKFTDACGLCLYFSPEGRSSAFWPSALSPVLLSFSKDPCSRLLVSPPQKAQFIFQKLGVFDKVQYVLFKLLKTVSAVIGHCDAHRNFAFPNNQLSEQLLLPLREVQPATAQSNTKVWILWKVREAFFGSRQLKCLKQPVSFLCPHASLHSTIPWPTTPPAAAAANTTAEIFERTPMTQLKRIVDLRASRKETVLWIVYL